MLKTTILPYSQNKMEDFSLADYGEAEDYSLEDDGEKEEEDNVFTLLLKARNALKEQFKSQPEHVVYEWINTQTPRGDGADLKLAARYGHMSVVELLLKRGSTELNEGLFGACKGGHVEIINFLIDKGADDFNLGLFGACRGGQRAIVDLMISKGADDWNQGLCGACTSGHVELARFMITKGADEWDEDWLCYAYEHCHVDMEVLDFMANHGANFERLFQGYYEEGGDWVFYHLFCVYSHKIEDKGRFDIWATVQCDYLIVFNMVLPYDLARILLSTLFNK